MGKSCCCLRQCIANAFHEHRTLAIEETKYFGLNFLVFHGHAGKMRAIDQFGHSILRSGSLRRGAFCLRRQHLRCGLGHSMRLGDVEGAVPIASSAPTLVSFLEFDPPGRESCPLLGSDRRRAKDAVNQKRHLFRRLRQNIKETASHAASAPYRPQCAQKIIGGRRNIVAAAARRCSNEPALTMIKDTLTSSFFCSAKPIR